MPDDCRMALTAEEARELLAAPYRWEERDELLTELLSACWPSWADISDEADWGESVAMDTASLIRGGMDDCPIPSRVCLTLWN